MVNKKTQPLAALIAEAKFLDRKSIKISELEEVIDKQCEAWKEKYKTYLPPYQLVVENCIKDLKGL